MNILAIDIGTHCGYAYNGGAGWWAGTWHLMSAKEVTAQAKVRLDRRKDARVARLCERVSNLGQFDVLVFEDVQFASTTLAAQMYAGLRSSLWLCGIATFFEAVPVGTLKRFASGNGAAKKDAMSAALKRQYPGLWKPEYDDNAIDAIWLHLWARKNLQRLDPSATLPK